MNAALISQLLSGLGLAGAAGLNAYIPLALVAALGRFGVIKLSAPFDLLTNTWVMVAIGVLLVVEFVVDKVPALDHANDLVQTVVRPAAGALVFAGGSGAISDVPAWLLVVAGLVTAFGVHATKAAARPVINTATVGVGAPIVSVVEDVVSVGTSLIAVFLPVLIIGVVLVGGYVAYRLSARLFRRA